METSFKDTELRINGVIQKVIGFIKVNDIEGEMDLIDKTIKDLSPEEVLDFLFKLAKGLAEEGLTNCAIEKYRRIIDLSDKSSAYHTPATEAIDQLLKTPKGLDNKGLDNTSLSPHNFTISTAFLELRELLLAENHISLSENFELQLNLTYLDESTSIKPIVELLAEKLKVTERAVLGIALLSCISYIDNEFFIQHDKNLELIKNPKLMKELEDILSPNNFEDLLLNDRYKLILFDAISQMKKDPKDRDLIANIMEKIGHEMSEIILHHSGSIFAGSFTNNSCLILPLSKIPKIEEGIVSILEREYENAVGIAKTRAINELIIDGTNLGGWEKRFFKDYEWDEAMLRLQERGSLDELKTFQDLTTNGIRKTISEPIKCLLEIVWIDQDQNGIIYPTIRFFFEKNSNGRGKQLNETEKKVFIDIIRKAGVAISNRHKNTKDIVLKRENLQFYEVREEDLGQDSDNNPFKGFTDGELEEFRLPGMVIFKIPPTSNYCKKMREAIFTHFAEEEPNNSIISADNNQILLTCRHMPFKLDFQLVDHANMPPRLKLSISVPQSEQGATVTSRDFSTTQRLPDYGLSIMLSEGKGITVSSVSISPQLLHMMRFQNLETVRNPENMILGESPINTLLHCLACITGEKRVHFPPPHEVVEMMTGEYPLKIREIETLFSHLAHQIGMRYSEETGGSTTIQGTIGEKTATKTLGMQIVEELKKNLSTQLIKEIDEELERLETISLEESNDNYNSFAFNKELLKEIKTTINTGGISQNSEDYNSLKFIRIALRNSRRLNH